VRLRHDSAGHDRPGERTADDRPGCGGLPEVARTLDTQELEQDGPHHLAAGLTRGHRRRRRRRL
jgi:hypothetical protein